MTATLHELLRRMVSTIAILIVVVVTLVGTACSAIACHPIRKGSSVLENDARRTTNQIIAVIVQDLQNRSDVQPVVVAPEFPYADFRTTNSIVKDIRRGVQSGCLITDFRDLAIQSSSASIRIRTDFFERGYGLHEVTIEKVFLVRSSEEGVWRVSEVKRESTLDAESPQPLTGTNSWWLPWPGK